jgi:hypothetical protein
MNYDLGTTAGMRNAVEWTTGMIGIIKDGGTWMVPRSLSVYEIRHSEKIAVRIMGGEDCIDRVFKEMGWTVRAKS